MEAHLHSGSADSDALCFVLGHWGHNFSWNLSLRWCWKPFFSLAFTRPACLLHPSWPIGFLTWIEVMAWNIVSVVWWRAEGRPMTKGSLRFSILAVKGRDRPQEQPCQMGATFQLQSGGKVWCDPSILKTYAKMVAGEMGWHKESHFTDGIYYLNPAWAKIQTQGVWLQNLYA